MTCKKYLCTGSDEWFDDNPPVICYHFISGFFPQTSVESDEVMSMERLPINNDGGQGYGFTLYQTELSQFPKKLLIEKVLDRAQVLWLSHILVLLN